MELQFVAFCMYVKHLQYRNTDQPRAFYMFYAAKKSCMGPLSLYEHHLSATRFIASSPAHPICHTTCLHRHRREMSLFDDVS